MHMPLAGAEHVASLRAKSPGSILHPLHPQQGVDAGAVMEGTVQPAIGRHRFLCFVSFTARRMQALPGSFGKVTATLVFVPAFLWEVR